MTEYINKNELLEELKYDRDNDGEIFHSHIEREIHDEKYDFAIDVIKYAPTVDVRSIIYSNWQTVNDLKYKCLKCGTYSTNKYNYCPNCGAKMLNVNI